MSHPDVSILIVNYNVKDYLLQCLRSIEQRGPGATVEVVVVDNASADHSVEELQPLFPWVTWVPLTTNLGFGKGNNVGLEHCTGRYVLFLNPDTIIGQDTVNVMMRYMDAHPDVGFAGCKVLNPDGSFQLACRRGLPTPWVSFCKLFGLQRLFPKTPFFAGYNLTYKSIDETYEVDALIGAFMFGRTADVRALHGFDEDFFMYGEDIDLCYRMQQTGKSIMYVHTTSIVHFKGESTKRSTMNEVSVFYDAMEIFARKHFARSTMYLRILRLGIRLRSMLERVLRQKREILSAIADVAVVNISLMLATAIRFDSPFGFPPYAYPTVFIVLSIVFLGSMVALGEYVENRPTIRRSLVALLAAFFVLSSLTYYWKQFGFSRGVLIMTVGFSAVGIMLVRGISAWLQATKGTTRKRRILVVGINERTERILAALQTVDHRFADVVGIIADDQLSATSLHGYPVLGTVGHVESIVRAHDVNEVIVTSATLGQADVMQIMHQSAGSGARFHMAGEYDDVVTARIINDVTGIEPTVVVSPLRRFRNRVLKRTMDVVMSLFSLFLYLPGLILGVEQARRRVPTWMSVLRGQRSVVGIYPDGKKRQAGKEGITGLVHISRPDVLSEQAKEQLNDFYVERYSLAMDLEILLQNIYGRERGQ
ncbi:MAG: glycosyltransferase [Bacteroidetes bacterium]|nr:glycosyltransferase [Bacteroidota bacterium]